LLDIFPNLGLSITQGRFDQFWEFFLNLLRDIKILENVDKKQLSKYLTKLKSDTETEWLKNYYSKMLQPLVNRIFSSIKGLSKSKNNGNKVGRLRFKSSNRFTSFLYNQSGFKIIETDNRYNKLHLSKIGDIHFKQSRDIIGKIKQVQIKLKPSGWYCYITTDGKYQVINKKNNRIGIDMGINNFLVTSDNKYIRNPLYLKQQLSKLQSLHKSISKKKKGSNNRKKAIFQLCKLMENISNKKNDFFHKLSTDLVQNNNFICIEDLNIKNIINKSDNKYKNHRNLLDSSWRKFIDMLKIKVSCIFSNNHQYYLRYYNHLLI